MRRAAWLVLLVATACQPGREPATEIEFPSRVGPPFGLDRLVGGMTRAEALAGVPELQLGAADHRSVLVLPSRAVTVFLDDDRVADVEVGLMRCEGLEAALVARWGPGHPGRRSKEIELLGTRMTVWASETSRWAVALRPVADGCVLEFTHADYFGRAGLPGSFAYLRPEMTGDEVERWVPGLARLASVEPAGLHEARAESSAWKTKSLSWVSISLSTAEAEALRIARGAGDRALGFERWSGVYPDGAVVAEPDAAERVGPPTLSWQMTAPAPP